MLGPYAVLVFEETFVVHLFVPEEEALWCFEIGHIITNIRMHKICRPRLQEIKLVIVIVVVSGDVMANTTPFNQSAIV